MSDRLDPESFARVVEDAPLVSIDLVIRDSSERILIGLRGNEPARGWWFVPGGRIRKNESVADAFVRISMAELGLTRSLNDARFLGYFENFYATNPSGTKGSGTHYVVLAFEIRVEETNLTLPDEQHGQWRWQDFRALLEDERVHHYTKDLAREAQVPSLPAECADPIVQYEMVAARRNELNALLWQTPVLSLTAQAFLFQIALNKTLGTAPQGIASVLALAISLGSLQLLLKHRGAEVRDAEWLTRFEQRYGKRGLCMVSAKPVRSTSWLENRPSHLVWAFILSLFGFAALYVLGTLLTGNTVGW